MDFGLSEEQSLLQDALRGFLADKLPMDRVRTVYEGGDGCLEGLAGELAAQGLCGVLVPADSGGSGLGLLDAAVAAEELGRAAAPCSFHSAYVMAPLALATAASGQDQRLAAIASGKLLASFVTGDFELAGGRVSGSARFAPDPQSAGLFIVACKEGDATRLVAVESGNDTVSVEPLVTVDGTRRLGELTISGATVDQGDLLGGDEALVERILDAGRIALAADVLGATERSLELAVEYSLTREQFGRPIGSFQSVKHMCAETIAEIEPLRALVWYAAYAWDESLADASWVAKTLKAHAGEVGTRATTTTVQVYGGMGFTWECDMHVWFKRAGYDRQVLGGPAELRAASIELQGL